MGVLVPSGDRPGPTEPAGEAGELRSRLLERREHVRAKGYALSRGMGPASRWSLLLSFKEKPSSRFRHRKKSRTQNCKAAQGKGAARAPSRDMGPASRWSLLLSFKEKPSSRFRHRKITRTQNRKTAQGKGAARAPLRGMGPASRWSLLLSFKEKPRWRF